MQISELAASALLGLSSLLQVTAITPNQLPDWKVNKPWTSTGESYSFEATSEKIIESCQQNPTAYVQFPNIIHSAHEVFVDDRLIMEFGDPTFREVRSFYGAPNLKCSDVLGGKVLKWRAYCYSKYFSRISIFPYINREKSHLNVYSESLNIAAAGSLMLMAFFTLIIFWGRVGSNLVLSIAASNLFLATYVVSSVSGFFGIYFSMLTTHKIADIGLWIGIMCFINALRIHGLVSKRIFVSLFAITSFAIALIFNGTNGDEVQLGTMLPFVLGLYVLFSCVGKLAFNLYEKGDRKSFLEFISLALFVSICVNDTLVVIGLSHSYTVLPLGFAGGLLFFALSVNERITETYRERDYLQGNLEKEVQIKTAELREKTTALQTAMNELKGAQADLIQSAKLASLGTLAAGIAHEINNSLNFVSGAIKPLEKLIDADIASDKKPKIQNLLSAMNQGLKLTFDIIKSLSNYTGLNQSELNEVSIRNVVDSVLTILKGKIGKKYDVQLSIADDIKVFGSVVGLNQVLMNLISNGLDAMGDTGTLTISARKNGDYVDVKVTDTGSGIPEEVKERIFEPFFTTKKVGSGSGLGLHIVKVEVERHHGFLKIESKVGTGTTFTLSLPSDLASKQEQAA